MTTSNRVTDEPSRADALREVFDDLGEPPKPIAQARVVPAKF
jgi:hypothetical protein